MAWRTLRWHPGSVLGALITLVIASAVMSSLWFVVDATQRQTPVVARHAGTPLVVTTGGISGAIKPGLVAAVRALPEVGSAVPELNFAAPLAVRGNAVHGPADQYPSPWGHGWGSAKLTPFRIEQGRPPRAAGEVVVDAQLADAAGISVGDDVDVRASGISRTHEVVGVAATSGRWRYQSALFFSDEHAAQLSEYPGAADALGVFPSRGTSDDELRQAVARVLEPYNSPGAPVFRIATGPDRAAAEGTYAPGGDGFSILWFLVFTTALISVGMVAAAMGVSIRRRGTEIAVLRAIGARPGQLRRLLLAEGLLLSLVAAVAGVPLGALVTPLVAGWFRDFGVVHVSFGMLYDPLPALGTALFTVAAALPASLLAVRRALRIRPGDALGEAPAEGRELGRGRLLIGLAMLAGVVALVLIEAANLVDRSNPLVRSAMDFGLLFLIVGGVGLVAPWAVLAVGVLLRPWAARGRRAGGFLSVANVAFNHRRFAGAVGALTLGVTLVGAVVGTQSFYDWRKADAAARVVSADHVLLPAGGNNVLAEELRRRLLDQPGTSEAAGIRKLPITLTPDGGPPVPRASAALVTGNLTQVLDLPVRGRPLDDLGDREIGLRESTAARAGAGIGSRLRIRLPGATEDGIYTVAAIFPHTVELAPVVLPRAAWSAAGLPRGRYAALYVRGPLDREAVTQTGGTVAGYDKEGYVRHKAAVSAAENRLLPYTSVLIAVFCLVAAVNGLCLALLDRRREFTGMRQLGMRRGQVMAMVCGEEVLTLLPAVALALTAAAGLASVHALAEGAGPAALASFVPFGWIALLGAGALLGAVTGSLLVVRTTMRNER